MKACSNCGVTKPAKDFQIRRASTDGRTASCRECLQARDKARYPNERIKRNAWFRRYFATERGAKIVTKCKTRWIERNLIKRAAHVITGNAVRDGILSKGPCDVCGAKKVHAHHDNYAEPLKVRWLCPKHYAEFHRNRYEHFPRH